MAGKGSDFRRELGQQLRVDSIRSSAAAGSGHPTSSMSAADLMAVLLDGHLRLDYQNPANPANDHLVFSKGHASPLYYSILKAAGRDRRRGVPDLPQARLAPRGPPHPADPADRRGDGLARPGPADLRRHRDGGPPPRQAAVPRLVPVRRLRDGRGLDVGGLPARRLGGPGQHRRDHRRQPPRPDPRDDARLGHGRLRRAHPRLRLARDRDRRPRRRRDRGRLRRGRVDQGQADGDHRPHQEGQGRQGGRGPARQARQAARRPGRGDRGARGLSRPVGRGRQARRRRGLARSRPRAASSPPGSSARRSPPARRTARR